MAKRLTRYIVDTKREPDAAQTAQIDYIGGLRAACAFAKNTAYSQQTRAVVKSLKTGKEIGAYRFAKGRENVVGRGRCK
jgi:hypothetical protein